MAVHSLHARWFRWGHRLRGTRLAKGAFGALLAVSIGVPNAFANGEQSVRITASADIAEHLLPIFMDAFAEVREAEVEALTLDGTPIPDLEGAASVHSTIILQLTDLSGEKAGRAHVEILSGSDSLIGALAGEADLIFTEAPIPADLLSRRRFAGTNLGSAETVLAVDGLVVAGHPDNPVEALSLREASAIFSGQIRDWAEIGGPAGAINVYALAPGTDGRRDLEAELLRPFRSSLSEGATIVGSGAELTAALARDPGGIGFTSFSTKRGAKPFPIRGACGLVAAPDAFTIKSEQYPLQHRIYAYQARSLTPFVRELLQLVQGPDGDGLVEKSGFTSLAVMPSSAEGAKRHVRATIASPGADIELVPFQNLLGDLLDAKRLSTMFRFEPGSSDLDNKGRSDVDRLVGFLAREAPERVTLVGFADSGGAASANRLLSLQRAERIFEEIQGRSGASDLSGVTFEVKGYGELAPLVCNDTFEGRATNRRVEVWLQ